MRRVPEIVMIIMLSVTVPVTQQPISKLDMSEFSATISRLPQIVLVRTGRLPVGVGLPDY